MEKIFIFLFYVYMFISSFFVLYFNYTFAIENGFVAWVFFGEIVATFKGLLWPFFI